MQDHKTILMPCPHRRVDDEGQILCDKIKTGDRHVSVDLCTTCPISSVQCGHLRAALHRIGRLPIPVRYGHGRTLMLEYDSPALALERAACAKQVTPILSAHDCAACSLREPLTRPVAAPLTAAPIPRRRPAHPAPICAASNSRRPVAAAPARSVPDRSQAALIAHKIVRLEHWLDRQERAAAPAAPRGEEKRVGWTD